MTSEIITSNCVLHPDLHLATFRIKCLFYGYFVTINNTSVYNGISMCCGILRMWWIMYVYWNS